MRSPRKRLMGVVAGLAAAMLVMAGCGDGGGPAEGEQQKTLSIGMFPVVDATPGQAAKIKGIFEKNGLDVTIKDTTGGVQAISSVAAGEFDIAFSNYVSIILAADQGLPLQIASGNNTGNRDHTVMAKADSPIKSPRDLEGKKVAVSHLRNIGVLAISNAVAEDGGDPKKVTYVEMPFPDMQAALERGDVDAIWVVEPFMAAGKEAGHQVVVENFSGAFEGIPVSGWVTTKEFAERNPDTIEAFMKSIDEASEIINEDEEARIEAVEAFTRVDAKTLESMVLPKWTGEVDKDGLNTLAEAMVKYEFLEKDFNVDDILPNG
ncbi:ABC transporter substrate-binding protein [Enemella sp. A6]|uniref:ABC transporter substrate-binding protein n=1 Tax=Enemella sp. A6 TaxID=3440152 RepID=UPI003EBE3E08